MHILVYKTCKIVLDLKTCIKTKVSSNRAESLRAGSERKHYAHLYKLFRQQICVMSVHS